MAPSPSAGDVSVGSGGAICFSKGSKYFDQFGAADKQGNIVFDNATPPNIILNPSPSQIQNFGQPLQVVNKEFYRQGMSNPDKVTTYTSLNKFMKRTQTKDGISSSFYEAFPVGPAHRYIPLDRDDSIFYNRNL